MQNTCLQRHFHSTGRKLTVRPHVRPYSCLHYSARWPSANGAVNSLYHWQFKWSDFSKTNKQTKEIYILNCIAKRKTQVVEYATSAVKIGFKSTNRFTFIVVKPNCLTLTVRCVQFHYMYLHKKTYCFYKLGQGRAV